MEHIQRIENIALSFYEKTQKVTLNRKVTSDQLRREGHIGFKARLLETNVKYNIIKSLNAARHAKYTQIAIYVYPRKATAILGLSSWVSLLLVLQKTFYRMTELRKGSVGLLHTTKVNRL